MILLLWGQSSAVDCNTSDYSLLPCTLRSIFLPVPAQRGSLVPPFSMDSGAPNNGDSDERRNQQVDNAIRAIRDKKPPVEIDFSIHVMEDGTQVSTMERVCKGTVLCT